VATWISIPLSRVAACFLSVRRVGGRSPKHVRSQPAANKKSVKGKSSSRIVRFRLRKSLCVFNIMPVL
jgi:hypothetical protein